MSPDHPEIEILRGGRWFASLPPALQARIAQMHAALGRLQRRGLVRVGFRVVELVEWGR